MILSAPSGSGKTSLANLLLQSTDNLEFSVSYTTRQPRDGEKHGTEYFFVSVEEFEGMIQRGEFLEHEHVYGNYYGTSRAFVESRLSAGRDVLLDIDVQGARAVLEQMPEAILIFVLPPSYGVLRERLEGRGLDDPEVVERRLRIARREIDSVNDYDYAIINEDIDRSVSQLRAVVQQRPEAEDHRVSIRRADIEAICRTFVLEPTNDL